MKNLREFALELEGGKIAYLPGDILHGELFLCLKKPLDIKCMKILLRGEGQGTILQQALASERKQDGDNSDDEKNLATSRKETKLKDEVVYKNSNKKLLLVDIKLVIFGKDGARDDQLETHASGRYAYEFEFDIPRNLPSTFKSPPEKNLGFIGYHLKAVIQRPNKHDKVTKMRIVINHALDPTRPELAYQPGSNVNKEISSGCVPAGTLAFEGYLNRSVYRQGAKILINAVADNGSTRLMKEIYAKLIRRVCYKARFGTKVYTQDAAFAHGPRVPPHKAVAWKNRPMRIPAVGPSIGGDVDVKVDYIVRVGMYEEMGSEIHVDLPVVIGTTAEDDKSDLEKPSRKKSRPGLHLVKAHARDKYKQELQARLHALGGKQSDGKGLYSDIWWHQKNALQDGEDKLPCEEPLIAAVEEGDMYADMDESAYLDALEKQGTRDDSRRRPTTSSDAHRKIRSSSSGTGLKDKGTAPTERSALGEAMHGRDKLKADPVSRVEIQGKSPEGMGSSGFRKAGLSPGTFTHSGLQTSKTGPERSSRDFEQSKVEKGFWLGEGPPTYDTNKDIAGVSSKKKLPKKEKEMLSQEGTGDSTGSSAVLYQKAAANKSSKHRSLQSPNNMLDQRLEHERKEDSGKGISHGEGTYGREPVNGRSFPESTSWKDPSTGKESLGIHESPIIPRSPLRDANASVDEETFLKEFEKLEETFRSESPSRNTQLSTRPSTATDRPSSSVSGPKGNRKQGSGNASSKLHKPEAKSTETEPVSTKLSGKRLDSEVREDFSRKTHDNGSPHIVPEVMTTGDRNYDREQRYHALRPEEMRGKLPQSEVSVEPELQSKVKESGPFHQTNTPLVGESLQRSNENQLMTGENKPRHTNSHLKPHMLEGVNQKTYPPSKGPAFAKQRAQANSDSPSAPYPELKREKSDAGMPAGSLPQSKGPGPSELDAQHEKIYPSLSVNEKADMYAPDNGAREGPRSRSDADLQQMNSKPVGGDEYFLNPSYSNSDKSAGDSIHSGFQPSEAYNTRSMSPILARTDPDRSRRLASNSALGHLKERDAELPHQIPRSAAGSMPLLQTEPLTVASGEPRSQSAELNGSKKEGADTESKPNVADQQRSDGFAKRAWEKVKSLIPKISKGVDSSTSSSSKATTGLKQENSESENKDPSTFASADARRSVVEDKTPNEPRLRDNIETNISLNNAEVKDKKNVHQMEGSGMPGFMTHEPSERPRNIGSVPTKEGLQSTLRLTDAPIYQPSSKEGESYGKTGPDTKSSHRLMLSSTDRYAPDMRLDDVELKPSHAVRNNESGDSEVAEKSLRLQNKERRLLGVTGTNRSDSLGQGRKELLSKPLESAPPELYGDEPEATLDDLVQRRVNSPLPAAIKQSRSKNKSSSQPAEKDVKGNFDKKPSDHESKSGDETSLLDRSGIVTELGRIDDLFDLKSNNITTPNKWRTLPRQASKPSGFSKASEARPRLAWSNKLQVADGKEKRIQYRVTSPAIARNTKDAPSRRNAGTVSIIRLIPSAYRPGTLSKPTPVSKVDNERYGTTGRNVRLGLKVKNPHMTLAPKTSTKIKANGLERPSKATYHSTRGLPFSCGRKLSPRSSLAKISKRPLETTRGLQLQSQAIAEVSEEWEDMPFEFTDRAISGEAAFASGRKSNVDKVSKYDDAYRHKARDKEHLVAPYYNKRGKAEYLALPKTLNIAAKAPITGKISKEASAKEENRSRASGSRVADGRRDQEEDGNRVAHSSTVVKHSCKRPARVTADESSKIVTSKISPLAKKTFGLKFQKKRSPAERVNNSAQGLIKPGNSEDKRPVVKVPWALTKPNPGILGSPTFRNVSMKPTLPSKKVPRSRMRVKPVEEDVSQKDNLTYTIEGCRKPEDDSTEIDELSDMENDGNVESGSSANKLREHAWKRSGTQVSTAVKHYAGEAKDLTILEQQTKRSSSQNKEAILSPSPDARRSSGPPKVAEAKERAEWEKPTDDALLPQPSGRVPDRNTISVPIEPKDKTQNIDEDNDSDRVDESRGFKERRGQTLANRANEIEDASSTSATGTLKDEDIQRRLPFTPIPEQREIFSDKLNSVQGSDARMKPNNDEIRSTEPLKAKNPVQNPTNASPALHEDKSTRSPAKTLHTSLEAPNNINRDHTIKQPPEAASVKTVPTKALAITFLKVTTQKSGSEKSESKSRLQAKQAKRLALKPEKMEGSKNRTQPSLGSDRQNVYKNGGQRRIKMADSTRREEEPKERSAAVVDQTASRKFNSSCHKRASRIPSDDLRDYLDRKQTTSVEKKIIKPPFDNKEQPATEKHTLVTDENRMQGRTVAEPYQTISSASKNELERPLTLPTPLFDYPKQLPMIPSYPLPESQNDRKHERKLEYQGMPQNVEVASPKAVTNLQGISRDTNQRKVKGSMPSINGGDIKPLVAQLPGRKSKRPQQESAVPKKSTKTWKLSISPREKKATLKAPSYAQRSRVKKKRSRKAYPVMSETTKLLLPAHPEGVTYKHPEHGTGKNHMQDVSIVSRNSPMQPQVFRERSRIWQHSQIKAFPSSPEHEEDRISVSKLSSKPPTARVKSQNADAVATDSSVASAGVAREGTTSPCSPYKQPEKGITNATETYLSHNQVAGRDIHYASKIEKLPGQATIPDSYPQPGSMKPCALKNISEIPTGTAYPKNNQRLATSHMSLHPRRARSVSPQNTERSRSEKRSRSSSPIKCSRSDDIETDVSYRVRNIQTPPITQNQDKVSFTIHSPDVSLVPLKTSQSHEYFGTHIPQDTRTQPRPTMHRPYEIGRYSVLYDVVPEVSEEESTARSSIKDKNSWTTGKQLTPSIPPRQSPRCQVEATSPRDNIAFESRGPVLHYVGHIERLDEQRKGSQTSQLKNEKPKKCAKQYDADKCYSSDAEVSNQANTSSDAELSWIFPLDAPENLQLPAPPTPQTQATNEQQKLEAKEAEYRNIPTRAAIYEPLTKESLVSQIEEKIERMHKQLDKELGIVEDKSISPILRADVSDRASRANPGGTQKIISVTNSQPVISTYNEPSRGSILEVSDVTRVATQPVANTMKAEVRISPEALLSSERKSNDESAIPEAVSSRQEIMFSNVNVSGNQASATSAQVIDLGRPTAEFLKNETEVIRDKYYGCASGGAVFSNVRPEEYGVQESFSKINKGSKANQLNVHDDLVVISGIRDAPYKVRSTSPSKLKKRPCEAPINPPQSQSTIIMNKNVKATSERSSLKLTETNANAHAKAEHAFIVSTPPMRVMSSGTRTASTLATQSTGLPSGKKLPPNSAPMPKQSASTTAKERRPGIEREMRVKDVRMSREMVATPVDNDGKDLNRIASQETAMEGASLYLSPSKIRFDPAAKADATTRRLSAEHRENSATGAHSASAVGNARSIIGTDTGMGNKAFACDKAERGTFVTEAHTFSGGVLPMSSTRRHDRADSFDLHELTFGIVDQHGRVINKERLIAVDDDLRSKDLVSDEPLLRRSRSTEPATEKTHKTHGGAVKSKSRSQRHVTKVTLINFADHLRSLKEGKRWSSCPAEIGQREGIYVVEDRSMSTSTDDQAEAPEDDVLDCQCHRRLLQGIDGTAKDALDGIQMDDDADNSIGIRRRMHLIAGGKDLEARAQTRNKDHAGTSTEISENRKNSSLPSRSTVGTPVQSDQVSYRIIKPSKSRTATYTKHFPHGGIISTTDHSSFGYGKPVEKRELTEKKKIGSLYWKPSSSYTPGSSEMRDRVGDNDLQFAWCSGRPVDSLDSSTESLSRNNAVLKSKEVAKTQR